MLKKILFSAFFLLLLSPYAVAAPGRFYAHGSPHVKKVALTFDDGPGRNTQAFLDILEEKSVKATFFMSGAQVKNRPELARRVRDAGHEIGNHTQNHINFFSYPGADKQKTFERELLEAEKSIFDATGVKTAVMRSPYGYSRFDAREVTGRHGYVMVNWSFGTDWDRNLSGQQMHQKYKAHIKPGAIFLMHDLSGDARVPSFLGQFIDDIRAAGLEIVTVSELLNLKE